MSESTVIQVANEFIELGLQDPNVPPIDQMKLQKLVFYCQSWYLAHHSAPLFEEDFEAWPWGPVVRDLYYKTTNFGRAKITDKLSELVETSNGSFKLITPSDITDPKIKNFIKSVWDSHKSLTGIQLSNSTHASDEPWTITKEQYGNLDSKPTIPTNLILSVFKKKLNDAKSNANSST